MESTKINDVEKKNLANAIREYEKEIDRLIENIEKLEEKQDALIDQYVNKYPDTCAEDLRGIIEIEIEDLDKEIEDLKATMAEYDKKISGKNKAGTCACDCGDYPTKCSDCSDDDEDEDEDVSEEDSYNEEWRNAAVNYIISLGKLQNLVYSIL